MCASYDVKHIINDNLDLSPLYSGAIEGIGPRYCPSIEDKIVKFPARDRHHIYLEPEGIRTKEVYVNGLSSSLPVFIQKQILKAMRCNSLEDLLGKIGSGNISIKNISANCNNFYTKNPGF